MQRNAAIGIVICACIIAGVSFLPWGLFQVPPENYSSSFYLVSFEGMTLTYTGDRLFSYLNILGVSIPNCVLIFSALIVAITSAFKAMKVMKFPIGFNMLLTLYGICHSTLVVVLLLANGSAGFGATVTVCMFVLMFVILLQNYAPEPFEKRPASQPSKY